MDERFFPEAEDILRLSKHRLITATGGGGKTSFLYAAGRALSRRGRVLITTTTKIFPPAEDECPNLFIGPPAGCVAAAAAAENRLLTAAGGRKPPKLIGYSPEEVSALAGDKRLAHVLTEADGSRGLSLKAYETWEPPVPGGTSLHVVVLGADILIAPLGRGNAFRAEELERRHGIKLGEPIDLKLLGALLSDRTEYLKNSPENAERVLLINKCDLLTRSASEDIPLTLAGYLSGYGAVVAASLKKNILYGTVSL